MARFDIAPETPGLFTRPDYYELLAALRREAPVYEYEPGSWTIAAYEHVRDVSRDPARFCSGRGVLMNDPLRNAGEIHGSILHMDPPVHAPWRQLVSRRFTPRATATFTDADRDDFRRWSDAAISSTDTDTPALDDLAALYRFLVDHVRARRNRDDDGRGGGDIVSTLANAEIDGRREHRARRPTAP